MSSLQNILRGSAAVLLAATSACAIEKPDYGVVEKNGKMELRQYDDIPVASAPMGDMENQNGSFMKLFRYIQGSNDQKQKIEMTAPVFMETGPQKADQVGAGRMSFMIPSEVAAKGAPAPTGEQVEVGTLTGGKIAVIRFEGHRSEEKRNAAVETLKAWVKVNSWTATGKPFFAYYDPPWTPEKMRRNEVWLRIAD